MSVSLCMIVKNEEGSLARCISSVKDIVDEIIVVDTGSTDETVKIAESFGAKLYYYQWDDSFSNARNFSLSNATKSWILMMDADDELEQEDKGKLMSVINKKAPDTNIYCGRTLCYSGQTPDAGSVLMNMNVRLIRNHKGYRYQGRVHEQIVLSKEDESNPYAMMATDIRFHHYGYLASYIAEKDKHTRNIGLISRELEEDPQNAFMLFNMGNEYFAMQETEKALGFYLKSFDGFEPTQNFCAVLLVRIVMCYEMLRNDRQLHRFAKMGLRYYPKLTDFEFLRGNAFLRQKKIGKAIRAYQKCIKMGTPPANTNSSAGVATFKPHFTLSTIYAKLGDGQRALQHCGKAIKYNPTDRTAYSHMIDLLQQKGVSLRSVKNKLIRQLPRKAESYLMLSDLFYDRMHYRQAYELVREAQKLSPGTPYITYCAGVCSFYLQKYKSAYRYLKKAGHDDALSSRVGFLRLLCTLFDEKIIEKDTGCRDEIDDAYLSIAEAFQKLVAGEDCATLGEDTEQSVRYIKPIFDLLEILLKTKRLEDFQKALGLVNLITSDEVLLLLGKLYYRNGYAKLSYHELSRSIKLTDKMDAEGLEMMKNALTALSA